MRIEDTDRARSTPEATQAILQGMAWLGLDHDGDVISQFDGADRHAAVAHELLAAGKAYKCYSTQDEIQAFRDAAKLKEKVPSFTAHGATHRQKANQMHPSLYVLKRPKTAPQSLRIKSKAT